MSKIQIEVTKAALKKIEKLGVKYTVVEDDLELRNLLFSSTSMSELDDHDQELIFNTAQEAIKLGKGYGIAIDTGSGRDNQDHRCYWLKSVVVVTVDQYPDFTVKQMLDV